MTLTEGLCQVSSRFVNQFTDLTSQDRNGKELCEYVLNPEEVARILDRSPQEVTELARKGKLRTKRMGRNWGFRRIDVIACLSQIDVSF